jgi:hypothetical protein
MKRQALAKDFKKKRQNPDRGPKNAKPAPQLPERPNEAPRRAPPLHPPTPEDDT